MVHGLANQSGGAFQLESEVGAGTKAELWLPTAGDAIVDAAPAPKPDAAAAPATILLVDDDILIAGSTVALLEDLGHRVVEAHSGSEALTIIDNGLTPDLVITDHAMPGMSGTDLALRLKAQNPRLPVLLATGYAELEGEACIDLPRLAKPYTQQQLSSEISRLLPPRAA
jgi:CheY-like chemotaxis protein